MRSTPQPFMLALFLAATSPGAALAHEVPGASTPGSVEARLQARDLRHEIDADGDFKIVLSWQKEARSQLVFVSGKHEHAGELAIRQVFAPAARIEDDGLDAETTRALLRDNARRILGHWAINDSLLLYVVNVPEDIDAAGLDTAINLAAETADEKELELTGGRDAL